jgi:NADH dehydrogenase FAD-containing subunit
MNKAVVIVDAGYGGATLARALDAVADVVLAELRDAFAHNVTALRGVVSPRWVDRMFLPYNALLTHGHVIHDRAVQVEPTTVTLASGDQLETDFVVRATGSSYPFWAKIDKTDTTDASLFGLRGPKAAMPDSPGEKS